MVSGAAGGGGRAGVVLWLSVRLRPEGLHQRRGQGFRDAKKPAVADGWRLPIPAAAGIG